MLAVAMSDLPRCGNCISIIPRIGGRALGAARQSIGRRNAWLTPALHRLVMQLQRSW